MNKQANTTTEEHVPHFPSLADAARCLAEIIVSYDMPQIIAESEGGDPVTTTVDEHLAGLAARDILNHYAPESNAMASDEAPAFWFCDEAVTTINGQGEREWLIIGEEQEYIGSTSSYELAQYVVSLHNQRLENEPGLTRYMEQIATSEGTAF